MKTQQLTIIFKTATKTRQLTTAVFQLHCKCFNKTNQSSFTQQALSERY